MVTAHLKYYKDASHKLFFAWPCYGWPLTIMLDEVPESQSIFSENGCGRFFRSEGDRDRFLRHPNMPELLFCSNVAARRSLSCTQSNYNAVSRGQSAIIQGFQDIIRGQSGGMRAGGYSPSARKTDIKRAINPYQKPIENVALSAKWNVQIWNRLWKCSSRL